MSSKSFLAIAVLFLVAAFAVLVLGCAAKVPQELRDARTTYQRAADDPASRRTPAQLYEAQKSLLLAERTFDEEGDSANTRDRAYIALRKAQLAEAQAHTAEYLAQAAAAASEQQRAQEKQAEATRQELSQTRAALAAEQATTASTREQLEAERVRRAEAEHRAAQSIAALARIASVTQEERGTVITLSGSVLFASGKSVLLPTAEARLRQVADALTGGDPDAIFVVEGHTDSTGKPDRNQKLSEERARTVREYLIAQGVPADRITSQGFGSTRPVAENSTAEGRANNRRVEIVIRPAP